MEFARALFFALQDLVTIAEELRSYSDETLDNLDPFLSIFLIGLVAKTFVARDAKSAKVAAKFARRCASILYRSNFLPSNDGPINNPL